MSLVGKSVRDYKSKLYTFLSWFNTIEISESNKHVILNEYQEYRVNVKGVQPQSTGVKTILLFLSEGILTDAVDYVAVKYIETLIKSTKISANNERNPETLTSYFSNITWLRYSMGEEFYLKLESPKRLMNSFSVVVSVTLLLVINIKKSIARNISISESVLSHIDCLKDKVDKVNNWNRSLMSECESMEISDEEKETIRELLLLDLVASNRCELFRERCFKESEAPIPLVLYDGKTRVKPYKEGCLFSENNYKGISEVEELLFAWLCACQTVQPNDVGKLKKNDFVVGMNGNDRPVTVQCQYYKGRSGRDVETPLLGSSDIEGKAIIAYLSLHDDKDKLFRTNINKRIHCTFIPHTPLAARIFRIWKSNHIKSIIDSELKKRKSSDIFLRAAMALYDCGGVGYDKWQHKRKDDGLDTSISLYRAEVTNPLPFSLFSLMAIKTSAVHARTDRYREADLVNYNSHTSETEKTSYLTDANKEWVNQNGRITRMVLSDIDEYVYKPNVNAAIDKARDMVMRTKIKSILGVGSEIGFKINPLGQVKLQSDESDWPIDFDEIVVLDTAETVINMKHYIDQAEKMRDVLIINALAYFERTILPTVEWMSTVLYSKISPKVLDQGLSDYEEIRHILPDLFGAVIHSSVGVE
jgi:hypothetical protein